MRILRRPRRIQPSRRFWACRRGGVAVEAAIVASVVLTLLFGILDLLVSLTLAQAADMAVFAAGRTLSTTRSVPAAQAAAARQLPGFAAGCLAPIAVTAYDHATPPILSAGSGYAGSGTLPGTALIARVYLTCTWKYMTPFLPSSGFVLNRTTVVGLE